MAKNYPPVTKRGHCPAPTAQLPSGNPGSASKYITKSKGAAVPFNGTQGKNKRPID